MRPSLSPRLNRSGRRELGFTIRRLCHRSEKSSSKWNRNCAVFVRVLLARRSALLVWFEQLKLLRQIPRDLPAQQLGVEPDMTLTSSVSTASTSTEPSIRQYSRPDGAGGVGYGGAADGRAGLARRARDGRTGAQRSALHPGAHRGAVRRIGVAFLLVTILVARERSGLHWPIVRDALWLCPPSALNRHGGFLWLWGTLPFVAGFFALQLVPVQLPMVAGHDFGAFLGSASGRQLCTATGGCSPSSW